MTKYAPYLLVFQKRLTNNSSNPIWQRMPDQCVNVLYHFDFDTACK
nr:MAG TPA: hypothetical protein [Bacteriophage sp.]